MILGGGGVKICLSIREKTNKHILAIYMVKCITLI